MWYYHVMYASGNKYYAQQYCDVNDLFRKKNNIYGRRREVLVSAESGVLQLVTYAKLMTLFPREFKEPHFAAIMVDF